MWYIYLLFIFSAISIIISTITLILCIKILRKTKSEDLYKSNVNDIYKRLKKSYTIKPNDC